MEQNYFYLDGSSFNTHFDGDEEMIGEIVEMFRETYPEVLNGLKVAVKDSDSKQIEYFAHTLKGMIANFFAEGLKDACSQLELMGKNQKLSNEQELLDKIETGIPLLLTDIEKYLSKG